MTTSVGIDVSKATLDVVLLVGNKFLYRQVSNDRQGWCELHQWLKAIPVENPHICVEATGVYGQPVARHMYH